MELMFGDCLEKLQEIPPSSIDLVVTSPPYDNLRSYNDSLDWCEDIWQKVFIQLFMVLKKGGVVVWVVGDATVNGSETGTSFKQALFAKSIGFNLHDTMIWRKVVSPFQHKNRYISVFEYMFIFSKEIGPKTSNLIKDRKNIWAGTRIHGTERMKTGETKRLSVIQKSKRVKEFGARHNVWCIVPERNNKTGHPAVFPYQLAYDHIISWSNEGDKVLDPFMGSGTTGIACINTDRNFIGIEKEKKYFEIAENRIFDCIMDKAILE